MNRREFNSLRAALDAESISYGELADIDAEFDKIDPATPSSFYGDLVATPLTMAGDKLDEIERAGLVVDDITVRYLLIELEFDGSGDEPERDGGPLDKAREAVESALELQRHLLGANVVQVYPGDVVEPDAVPDIFDLDVRESLYGAKLFAARALDALSDEREGDLKQALADMLDLATKLARFAGAM